MGNMTNAATIGYMILAAKAIGLDKETIKQLEKQMYRMMDIKTEEEAEEAYNNF